MDARRFASLLGPQDAVAGAELAHLGHGMLLHLLEFLLLLPAELEPATLHQDELGEELGLLQQEIEFLAAPHLRLGRRGHWTRLAPSRRSSRVTL